MLCAVIILMVGCTTVPNSKVEPAQPPPVMLSEPPMPPGMFMPKARQRQVEPSFALSETFTAPESAYVSPVPTNAPSFGTIKLVSDDAIITWGNWPTNEPYIIEVSNDLKRWVTLASGMSSSNSTEITILDRSVRDDYQIFFYRLVPQ
jgi:hypothetical protein